jgi:hypothetical protein
MEFLQLKINDNYNYGMGSLDIANQLCNYYPKDPCMGKRKWWWAYFFWGLGFLQTNAYKYYLRYIIMWGQLSYQFLLHYCFQQNIALAWINTIAHWAEKHALPKKKRKRAQSKKPDVVFFSVAGYILIFTAILLNLVLCHQVVEHQIGYTI